MYTGNNVFLVTLRYQNDNFKMPPVSLISPVRDKVEWGIIMQGRLTLSRRVTDNNFHHTFKFRTIFFVDEYNTNMMCEKPQALTYLL